MTEIRKLNLSYYSFSHRNEWMVAIKIWIKTSERAYVCVSASEGKLELPIHIHMDTMSFSCGRNTISAQVKQFVFHIYLNPFCDLN